eukprot:COSAG06_NODE_60886_length_269_cov_0.911765_1_plen_52_part_10
MNTWLTDLRSKWHNAWIGLGNCCGDGIKTLDIGGTIIWLYETAHAHTHTHTH